MGLLQPDAGSYRWFGEPASKLHRRRIGALIEHPHFYPYLSVCDNMRIIAQIKNYTTDDIQEALGTTGLLTRKHSKFGHLSLGLRQRLGIAAALLGNPDVLVLDEPTNGLDPEGFADIRRIIKEQAARGKTIIMASHLLDEVEKVCSHVAVLKSGQLLADGPVGKLLATETIVLIDAEDREKLKAVLSTHPGSLRMETRAECLHVFLPDGISAAELNQFAYEQGVVINRLQTQQPTLENQFLELVK
jgi:ABC-2 type transport system ATP-binding protein